MKCTKIVLTSRNAINSDNKKNEHFGDSAEVMWSTKGYHGYSYKLAARTKELCTPGRADPKLTITTLIFPENVTFNTGASLEKWSRKAPRLLSAKCKSFPPRKLLSPTLDDDYDISYPLTDLFEEPQPPDSPLNFDDYFVASDIEELMLKSEELADRPKKGKSKEEKAKKKRNKFKKTIRFSLSKPASPETEQVIRVDVTSNVSFEDTSQLDSEMGRKRNNKNQPTRRIDKNNNENCQEDAEEDFIVKCRQLALTQKKI